MTASQRPYPRPRVQLVPAKPGLPVEGGKLDVLVTIGVDHPAVSAQRQPLSLALVIDRSGSMTGPPLEEAKRAAQLAVSMLLPGDWVSVVAFDDAVRVPQALVRVGDDRRALQNAIAAIGPGSSTNLFAGWAEGLSQVLTCPEEGVVSRVVLLSDGMANVGVTDSAQISSDVAEASVHGVTTTTMGLGRSYDEALLRAMADAGRGNYVFLADERAMGLAFEEEIAGLSALRGRNVRLVARPSDATLLRHADPVMAAAVGLAPDAHGVALPDLVAGMPIDQLLTLEVTPGQHDLKLQLYWDDALTGAPDDESYPSHLPVLSATGWEAAPVDARVALARALLDIAAAKREFARVARTGDRVIAHERLAGLLKALAGLPVGADRDREEAEIMELKRRLEAGDHVMAARQSEVDARNYVKSATSAKRSEMFKLELERRLRSGAPTTPAGGPGAAQAFGGPGDVLFQADVGAARVQIVKGDITRQMVDAVVNSTSRAMIGAAGVDGALARAGGPKHLAAMRAIGGLAYGQAVFTPAFGIPARYVIHTAAHPWEGGGKEVDILRQCYDAVFALAESLGAKTLAMPAIGTGSYRFPATVAARIATDATEAWLARGAFELVRLVVVEDFVATAYLREASDRVARLNAGV